MTCSFFFVLLFLATLTTPATAVVHLNSHEIDQQAVQTVQKLSNAFEAAFNNHDVSRLVGFYSEQSILSLPGAPRPLRGLGEISNAFHSLFTVGGARSLYVTTDDIHRVYGSAGNGVYVETGPYVLSVNTPDGGVATSGVPIKCCGISTETVGRLCRM